MRIFYSCVLNRTRQISDRLIFSDKTKSSDQCTKLFHILIHFSPKKTTLYRHFFFSRAELLQDSHKPVKTDLDGAPWFSLNDPLTAQGVLVVAWPPRGQNDTRWP